MMMSQKNEVQFPYAQLRQLFQPSTGAKIDGNSNFIVVNEIDVAGILDVE